MAGSIRELNYKEYLQNRMLQAFLKIMLFTGYFAPFIYLVFFARRRHYIHTRYLNLVPIKNILFDLSNPVNISRYDFYSNLIGNVLLFMPLPLILIFIFRMEKFATIILTGLLLSIAVELIQYIFLIGVSDIDDVLLNTLGTFIGFLLIRAAKKMTT